MTQVYKKHVWDKYNQVTQQLMCFYSMCTEKYIPIIFEWGYSNKEMTFICNQMSGEPHKLDL